MKKIAAPRPLKRSGVVPTTAVRNNLAVAQMYFRDDDDEEVEVEVESSIERNDHGDLLYSALTNSYRYAAHHHLDNESIEMEGSCEIQRIFLSGLHTPGPRGGGANDEDDEGDRDSRLYFLGDPRASPSFQFFIPPPTRSGYDGNEEEEEDHDASSYGISRDFPLLGHSPYEPLHRPNNNNSDDDDDDEASYFQGYHHHHYPRAANPMPLNTPFHAALANDTPLYESQHLVVGARGQFFTLPSGGHTRLHKGDAFPQQQQQQQQQQQHLNWEAAEEASFQGAGDTNRTTRNRSYSEPIPFVPAATPTRS
jgi:hypothetical protein